MDKQANLGINTSSMPEVDSNGWIPTLNGMGWMTMTIDPIAQKFVDFAATSSNPVLEIGCAYGNVALKALSVGATYIAIDPEARHLEILESQLKPLERSKFKPICGYFPDVEIEGPIDAAFAGRVFHFLSGEQLEKAAEVLFVKLSSGGKVFVVADSPYRGTTREFVEVYELRKLAGVPWPGYVENISKYNKFAAANQTVLPKSMHLLDPDVLTRTFKQAGFIIEMAAFVSRPDLPSMLHLDQREGVVMIARKP